MYEQKAQLDTKKRGGMTTLAVLVKSVLLKKWKQEHKQGMLLKDKESEGHIERLG